MDNIKFRLWRCPQSNQDDGWISELPALEIPFGGQFLGDVCDYEKDATTLLCRLRLALWRSDVCCVMASYITHRAAPAFPSVISLAVLMMVMMTMSMMVGEKIKNICRTVKVTKLGGRKEPVIQFSIAANLAPRVKLEQESPRDHSKLLSPSSPFSFFLLISFTFCCSYRDWST